MDLTLAGSLAAIAIKPSDLSTNERARIEEAAGQDRGLHVVHEGRVYEALGFRQGVVVTRHLNGEVGPQLPEADVEVLERD